MDDILIFSETFADHLVRLDAVMDAIKQAGLLLQIRKCLFVSDKTVYLGHVVSREEIAPDPEKVRAMLEFLAPRTVKELRRFLGMAFYYRRFVRGFAKAAAPLTALLKKGAIWSWGPEEQEAFQSLLGRLADAPVLAHLDESGSMAHRSDIII